MQELLRTLDGQAVSGDRDRGAGRRVPALTACAAPASLALTGTAAASGLAAAGRGEENGGAEGHDGRGRKARAHAAGLLQKCPQSTGPHEALASLDSLSFFMEVGRSSLGPRGLGSVKEEWASPEGTHRPWLPLLGLWSRGSSSLCRSRAALAQHTGGHTHPFPKGWAYKGLREEHSFRGWKAWNSPPLQAKEQRWDSKGPTGIWKDQKIKEENVDLSSPSLYLGCKNSIAFYCFDIIP